MNRINIFITFILLPLFFSCASYSPQYKFPSPLLESTSDSIDKSFYLIGNSAKKGGELSNAMKSMASYINNTNSKDSYVIFLGNSFYNETMDAKDKKLDKKSAASMKNQLEALKTFKGKILVLPGPNEWKAGVDGLEQQEDFLKAQLDEKDILQPNNGCPLEGIEINDDIYLLAVDTQWFIGDWDQYPEMNKKCDIKTRDKFFSEIESELKKNAEKTIIFAMYHPLYTYGQHGGKYPPIHKDVWSTLIKPIKAQGAISKQDRFNERYNNLMNRIRVLTKDSEKLIFVSALDESLQYIENGSVKQIVSGAGSGATAARLGQYGQFSYGGEGFAKLDIMKNGGVEVGFYKTSTDNDADLIFSKEIFPSGKGYDFSTLHQNFPATVKAKIYDDSLVDKTGFYKTIWGEHYRKVYGTEVTAKTVLLDTLYGGLHVVRPGGGHQTVSLRLEDDKGRTYNMRGMKKSAVQFLQNVIVKDKMVEDKFKNTLPEDLILDFYTAAHPYGAFAIPRLSNAAGILHTNPKLFYVPKQKALGKYNEDYGDDLYMIVERPDKRFDGPLFDYPDNIESTDDLLEKLQRSEKYTLDQKAYIRARIFDMLIGDWDRHADQWRFVQHDRDDGTTTFLPIPRDRDQVFSNFDGGLLDVVRSLFTTSRQFQEYGPELKHTEWFNAAGIKLDRALVQNYGREAWREEAEYLQKHITDKIIDESFKDLPAEVQDETSEEIKAKLKGRRDNIIKIAMEYFDYFAKLQTVTGTNKDDYFEITRMPGGETNIKTYRIKKGEKGELMLDRTFNSKDTKEIWIYGLDDDDVFEVKGEGDKLIPIKIVGGQNNDVYKIFNGKKIKVYDHKSKKNTVEEKGGASFRLTDNYDFNTYDFKKQKQIVNLLVPAFGYNPDDGFKIGPLNILTISGFQQNPFSQQHRIGFGYYFATSSFEVNYEGEFANIFGRWNFLIGGHYNNPNFSENFFGFGNETINPDYEFDTGKDYNRVRIGSYGGFIGIKKDGPYGSLLEFRTKVEGIKIEPTYGRFISELTPSPIELDKTHYYATAEGIYQYESHDNKVVPTRGMEFTLVAGATQNLKDEEKVYGYVNPKLIFYHALSHNRKLVLKTHMQGQFNIGNNFEFFQAAQLGSDTGLRSYRKERFSGRSAFAGGGDVRYGFDSFKTRITPLQLGIFAGYDVGRVWVPNDDSDKWHSSYGGGFWVNAADLLSGTVNLFTGEEGLRVTAGVLFSF